MQRPFPPSFVAQLFSLFFCSCLFFVVLFYCWSSGVHLMPRHSPFVLHTFRLLVSLHPLLFFICTVVLLSFIRSGYLSFALFFFVVQVYVSQLQETPEVSTGLDSLQGYELYDLVMLGPNEVGVVTRVNREVRGEETRPLCWCWCSRDTASSVGHTRFCACFTSVCCLFFISFGVVMNTFFFFSETQRIHLDIHGEESSKDDKLEMNPLR